MKFAHLIGAALFTLVLGVGEPPVKGQETMRVAIPLFPTAAFPVLVANDRGFFRREGLLVEPIRINSAPTTYQALMSCRSASGLTVRSRSSSRAIDQ